MCHAISKYSKVLQIIPKPIKITTLHTTTSTNYLALTALHAVGLSLINTSVQLSQSILSILSYSKLWDIIFKTRV